MKHMPPERFVEVVWIDAYADKPTKAFTVEEVTHADSDNLPVITRGWLLREDAKGVSLAPEAYFNTDDQKWNYRGKTFILKSMIVTMSNFPPIRPRRRQRVSSALDSSPDASPSDA